MYGYESDESEELMPLPIVLARRIAMRMDKENNHSYFFGSDGKCQVSVLYNDYNKPVKVTTVVVSQQTKDGIPRSLYEKLITDIVKECIPNNLLTPATKILINPTGEFVKGGAYADSGLTGRKIICDTYGGLGRHGGGAFSGKDYTKVDRTAAYYARYVAKNIVASHIAKRCEVQVGYRVGVAEPVSLNINTFGTSKYKDEEILNAVKQLFNFKPKNMINEIIDDTFTFESLAQYGHVGRNDIYLPWERTNKAYILRAYLKDRYGTKTRR